MLRDGPSENSPVPAGGSKGTGGSGAHRAATDERVHGRVAGAGLALTSTLSS